MVQVLPANPRKGPGFLESLVGGAAQGLPSAIQDFQQRKAQTQAIAQENEQLKKMGIDLSGIADPKMRQTAFSEAVKGMQKQKLFQEKQAAFSDLFKGKQPQESNLGNQLVGKEEQGIEPSQFSPEQILEGTMLEPTLGRAMQGLQDVALREKREEQKIQTDKEKEYFKLNEPKLMEIADSLTKLENEAARYGRLEQLFSDPSKFPSAFTAALFSNEGQINDKAYALLSPEAQEAIKLIVDSTSNIKDTYGSRVTNFDLQTYLKKLPGLLNTPEGKQRVLRDLQIINQLNQMHANGIMEIFQQEGGTDKIPYSKAEAIYRKTYGPQEKRLRELFVNPEKQSFKEMPSAYQYLGRKIRNPETGEIFISDGKEWKPYRGE